MSRTLRQAATTTLLGTAVLLSACGKKDAATTDSTTATASTTSSTSTATTTTPSADSARATASAPVDPAHFTDANILAKEMAGDSGEVAIAKMAQGMATNAAVKSYAALLLADHGKGLTEVAATAKKTNITPATAMGDTTSIAAANALTRLQGMAKGAAFDTAFVNHEIEDHKQDIADNQAMSGAAQNADVKALLAKSLPELKKHLDRAQKISVK